MILYIKWRYVDENSLKNLIELNQIKGLPGKDGKDGKSAYELYKEQYPNYEGNEEQWLDDLINGRLSQKKYIQLLLILMMGLKWYLRKFNLK